MPPRPRPRLFAALLSTGLAVACSVAAAPAASALETGDDARAEVREGLLAEPQCEQFGGGILVSVEDGGMIQNIGLSYDGGVPVQDDYVTITDLPDDIAVTAIVVEGGSRHHVYLPGRSGLAKSHPWVELRAPVGSDGTVPVISRWFACGEEAPSATATTKPQSGPDEPPRDGALEQPEAELPAEPPSRTSTITPTSAETAVPTTPTTESDGAVAADDELASTGFGSGWLIAVGVALLACGGALVAATRRRRGEEA